MIREVAPLLIAAFALMALPLVCFLLDDWCADRRARRRVSERERLAALNRAAQPERWQGGWKR